MFEQLHRVAAAALFAIVLVGCTDLKLPEERLLRQPFDPTAMHRFYEPMIENAAAHDMSVADVHFVPHTEVLNDLGRRRLDQLAAILARHGGLVRYETHSTDVDRNAARIEEIESYLTDGGLDMANVEVAAMMSGGRGLSASAALAARDQARGDTKPGGG